MDDIDLRLLTLERIVSHLRKQVLSTKQRLLSNSTLLNNSGPMAGSLPATPSPSPDPPPAGSPTSPCTVGGLNGNICEDTGANPIPANDKMAYSCGGGRYVTFYNTMGTAVPAHSTVEVQYSPALSGAAGDSFVILRQL